jgi:hypothetical protein
MSERVLTEEFGVKAIIALQAAGGIEESEKQARAGWRSISTNSKQSTEMAHGIVCGGFDNPEHEDA